MTLSGEAAAKVFVLIGFVPAEARRRASISRWRTSFNGIGECFHHRAGLSDAIDRHLTRPSIEGLAHRLNQPLALVEEARAHRQRTRTAPSRWNTNYRRKPLPLCLAASRTSRALSPLLRAFRRAAVARAYFAHYSIYRQLTARFAMALARTSIQHSHSLPSTTCK